MTSRAPAFPLISATGEAMRRLGRWCCVCAALLAAGCATYGPERPGEKIYRDVVFAAPGGHKLRMDIYVPRQSKPAPVVLWFFGGGWSFGSKGYHVNVRDLTTAGIAVASVQYRMSHTAVYPAQLEDCRAAAQWLRDNGARYGIDSTRMGASGESSGGQLAAMLAAAEGKSRIRAVCALYAPTDMVELAQLYSKPGRLSLVDKFLGGPADQKLDVAVNASPLNYISRALPPFLIIHGEFDGVVPLEQSERLFLALTDVGVETQFIVVPGKRHWFRLDNTQFAEVSRFFQVNLKR
ncbi:alpha/beta hydrolase fold domain-containing protein [Prosthecobacter sp.]|uniref:alpha/beta hydrolase fold domain-containing protein n=1 Tax=Prosthecobacter sp. TaxID=1965333 RepID=UPI00378410E8